MTLPFFFIYRFLPNYCWLLNLFVVNLFRLTVWIVMFGLGGFGIDVIFSMKPCPSSSVKFLNITDIGYNEWKHAWGNWLHCASSSIWKWILNLFQGMMKCYFKLFHRCYLAEIGWLFVCSILHFVKGFGFLCPPWWYTSQNIDVFEILNIHDTNTG